MSKKVLKRVLIGIFISLALIILSIMLFLSVAYSKAKLNIDTLTNVNSGVKLYSSNYMDTQENYSYNLNRKIVDINELNDYTINAFIDIEDKRFYSHNGYDIKRMVKSALVNLKEKNKSQGASTITQQLVKNTLLSNEKTYERKINEVMLSIKIEKEFSKEEIMNMYLNTIYFGSNAYGIENASQIYFNKSSVDLSLNESVILAGLIKSPKKYSPKLNPKNCFNRKNLVLKEMLKNNHISKKEYDENVAKPVECSSYINSYDNSYYQQAIIEACNLLNISEKELIRNNYQIITYLDNNINDKIKNIYETLNFNCDKLTIVANNKGEILSYIGNSMYDLSEMRRSPASTIKPFAVYLPLLEHNMMYSCTPVLDEEINFDGYSPKNHNNTYSGWISAKDSLSNSLNIPTVKLLNVLGIEKSINFLKKLGISVDSNDHNLSLALGGLTKGLSPKDILELYTVLQNNGVKNNLRFVDKILDSNGHIVYDNSLKEVNVCSPSSSYLITDMLLESSKSGTAKQLSSLDYQVASKTGTNSVNGNILDLYNVCYTADISILSWLGDATNNGLKDISSSFEATKLNKEILQSIYNDSKPEDFTIPDTLVKKDIDLLEYNINHRVVLATDNTPERYKKSELFRINHIPISNNSIYQSPNLDFDIILTNTGIKINLETSEIFDYEIMKITDSNNTVIPINSYINTKEIVDEKVFCYNNIKYQLKATHKYTNQVFESEIKEVYPKDYLLSTLKNQEIIYDLSGKKRWYVWLRIT